MIKKVLLAAAALLILGVIALALIARSMLGSESVRSRLEQQLSAWTAQPVTIGSAGASVFPRVTLELRDVAIGQPPAIAAGRVDIATGLRGLFSRRIEEAEVVVSDGTVTLPLPASLTAASTGATPPAPPRGSPPPSPNPPAAAPADAAEQTAGGFTVASVRVIAARNLTVAVSGKRVQVDLESALTGDRLDVSRLALKSEHTNIAARGALTSLARLEGSFTVTGSPLDLDELLALAAGLSGSTAAASPSAASARTTPSSAMDLALQVAADKGRLAGYDFTKLAATLDITPTQVRMSPLSLAMFGGTFKGSLAADPTQAQPRVRLDGAVAGIDVPALTAAAGSPGGITGRLGGTVALTGTATGDTAALLRTLSGSADAAITDGHIPNLDIVRTVVLAFGKPSGAPAAGSGSAFTRLGGTFALERGALSSSNLSFASRDFDMHGRMTMTVPAGVLDAAVNVVLSEELTAQAGTDLRRYAQEDGRVVVPARITGTLASPSVTIDVAAAMNRALQNEIKRRGKSLLDSLFKRRGPG